MRMEEVGAGTEDIFLRCLHVEEPADPVMMRLRRDWHHRMKEKGLRAKVVRQEDGRVAGLCQYMPIEHSNYLGEGLMAILCMWVHGYEHYIGDVQGNGMGRLMLAEVERDSCESGFKGVAVWGKDFPYWNPISFYEHMGYERADQIGQDVLAWKSFSPDALPPSFPRRKRELPDTPGKINLAVFHSGWCGGEVYFSNIVIPEAVKGLDEEIDILHVDTSERDALEKWGISSGLFMDGEPYRQDGPPCTAEELRADILKRFAELDGVDL